MPSDLEPYLHCKARTLWDKWFKSRGLYPDNVDDLLNAPECLGTWVARRKQAVASVTLWDTQSSVVPVSLGWWYCFTHCLNAPIWLLRCPRC